MKTNELEIIGYSNEKKEIERLCETLIRSDDYRDIGVRVPGGLVIFGPSGSGKTLMATSMGSDEIKIYEITEADILSEEGYRLKSVFDEAKNNAPAIVLLDGLDKVLQSANKLLFNKRDSVILYKERKPGIYTEFDDHMRRVIVLEFYRRIIASYLDKTNR